MLAWLSDRLPEIEVICRRRGVRRLEVFGSAARGDFDPDSSDVDFLVELEDRPGTSGLDAYFGLKEELEALIRLPVDLVMPGAIRNPHLRRAIARDRQLVYEA